MRASAAGSARVTRRLARLPVLVVTLCLGPDAARAQDPPTITYTSANGLGHDVVTRLLLDPRGFLWVGGPSSLARFDGERFTVYGHAEGLDVGTAVNDLKIGPQGDLWIATNGAGIFRLDLASTDRDARFTQIHVGEGRPSNRVNTILVTPDGHLWAGTDAGLFVGAARQPLQRLTLPLPPRYAPDQIQITALAGKDAWVWIGGSAGVHRCNSNGTGCRAAASPGRVRFIDMSPDGRLRVGRAAGIEIWTLDAAGLTVEPPETIRGDWLPRRIGNASDGLLVVSDDRQVIWTHNRTERVLFTMVGHNLNDIVEDAAGNLWVATYGGLVAIRRQGVTLFSAHRALRPPQLRRLSGTAASRPYVVTQDDSVHRIDGEVVTSARVVRPPGVSRSAWGDWSIHLDQANDVWMATAAGLYRFSNIRFSSDRPPEVAPSHRYTMADGLASDHLAEIFEDSRGDLWISHLPGRAETITVWRRRFGRFEKIGPAEGLPAANQVGNFVEGGDGDIWARMREGGIVRFRGNRATVFGSGHGLELLVTALLFDRHGNLWIGRGDNLLRASNPGADDLHVEPVLTRMGATVSSLEQDKADNILVGTYAGLLSFDPATGSIRRFSSFEGLPSGSVDALIAEPDGTVLLTAGGTLARLDPAVPARGTSQPRCVIGALRIGARTLPWPETGLDRIEGLAISPSENQIEIELVGVSPRLGEPLAYEYRLLGVSDAWTRAPERRVRYAGLAAGRYTLEARVSGAGGTSVSPSARVEFRVLPPWYRQWWFLGLVGAATVLVGYLFHRAQLAQAVRTERLRSRIATDLHDDIGASLSQIAILAEVARRRGTGPGVAEPLASIATTSRDLVDAMSDIVWAVNPRTDSLSDLTHRMHRFAEESLGGADIALQFTAPPDDVDLRIGADLRRELYLILKESVNNIARHSGASRAVVELTLARHELRLLISDDGRGFDPGASVDGNGIASMRKRAAAFGGVFAIDSAAGRGTRVTLVANLRGLPR